MNTASYSPELRRLVEQRTETRPYRVYLYRLAAPHSVSVLFDCPFCGHEEKARTLTLSTGGKRCGCGALAGVDVSSRFKAVA